MTQTVLDGYGYTEIIIKSHSNPTTNHVVSRCDGQYFCSCPGFTYHGHCYHVYQEIINDIKDRLEYFSKRTEVLSEAEFRTLDQALERLSENEEVNYLCNLILILARTKRQVTPDDVYETIQGKFSGSPNRMGIAFGLLSRAGRIRSIGRRRSNRKIRHAGKQDVWVLTKEEEGIT